MSADWLTRELLGIIESTDDERVKLDVIKSALSRAGISEKQSVEAEITNTKKFEVTVTKAVQFNRGSAEASDELDRYSQREAGIVDAEVIEESTEPIRPTLPTGEAAHQASPAPREEWVNSSDEPPRHIAQRTPGYMSRGGTKRTPTEMRR